MSETNHLYGHGLVLGKFMPAHLGHAHLIRVACGLCDTVTVVVDRLAGEYPDAGTRAALLRQDLADLAVTVTALPEATPQQPGDHPQFWDFWRTTLLGACGRAPDVLVCSMAYGQPLAEAIGCALLPLDIGREAISLSATDIRADPWGNWFRMLPHARGPYLTRIAIEGPESSGKSTIARKLAAEAGFGYAPEFAKCYIDQRQRAGIGFAETDLLTIAHGQIATERSLALQADRVLLCDSSLLTTITWSDFLYGRIDPRLERLFAAEEARAPRRRWFFTPETPWIHDTHRDVAADAGALETRRRFWDLLVAHAERLGLAYLVVPGGFADKESMVQNLLRSLGPIDQ